MTTILCVLVIIVLCIMVDRQEGREYKALHGFSRKDFKHYRKMMASSDYRKKNKLNISEQLKSFHHN